MSDKVRLAAHAEVWLIAATTLGNSPAMTSEELSDVRLIAGLVVGERGGRTVGYPYWRVARIEWGEE